MGRLGRSIAFLLSAGACASPPAASTPAATRPAASVPAASSVRAPSPVARRVEVESGGWKLFGDFLAPASEQRVPGVLLLHRAAGSRKEYVGLAEALAERGVASLRLDLRACGESTNLGRFEEPYAEHLSLLEGTHEDVEVALSWLQAEPTVDAGRLGAVGASYSGEAIGKALREKNLALGAYVMLSPGSFTDESIAAVSTSGAAWLFVRTTEESRVSREFIDAVFDAVAEKAKSAEIEVIEGAGHATHILDEHPAVVARIADWLAARLDAKRAPTEASGRSGDES